MTNTHQQLRHRGEYKLVIADDYPMHFFTCLPDKHYIAVYKNLLFVDNFKDSVNSTNRANAEVNRNDAQNRVGISLTGAEVTIYMDNTYHTFRKPDVYMMNIENKTAFEIENTLNQAFQTLTENSILPGHYNGTNLTIGNQTFTLTNVSNTYKNKIDLLIQYPQEGPLVYYSKIGDQWFPQSQNSVGGKASGTSKIRNLIRTTEKVKTHKGDRIVYKGQRGGKYVKIDGNFVLLSKLLR